jgi:signal transduction histidine kinase/ActR/RegA family two-component response regulator
MAAQKAGRASLFLGVCALIAVAFLVWSSVHNRGTRLRRVRIGVDQAAPYQSWSPGRGPVGFSVDTLNEAARKAHIELQWEFHPEGPKQAFASHSVDLWPLWAVRAAVQSGIYASEPWLDNQYAVVWQGDGSGAHRDPPSWAGRNVAVAKLPLGRQLARQSFPGSIEYPAPDRTAALQLLCRRQADAAFMEVRLLEAMLMRRPQGCETADFRVEVIDELPAKMAIASTPEYRDEANRLRIQIELMFQDGRFAKFVGRWFVFSNIEARSLANLQQQRRKNIYTLVALGGVLIFLGLLFLMYRHARFARETAERASRAKSEFLANVSHDVRTPMNGVLAMADLLLATPLTEQQRDYAVTIRQSADRQLAILNDLLDTAKIEAGKLVLEKAVFCPGDLLKQVRLSFSAPAKEKGLQLILQCAGLPEAVEGDSLRLAQTLANLVSNAIKFTERGEVVMDAKGVLDGDRVSLTFSVKDTGIGIDPRQHAHIFEKFTQADGSTTRRFGGTGLGLSISARLVEAMGGHLELESAPGAGSRFWFSISLPVAERAAGFVPAKDSEARLRSDLPVLIAEDNQVNQKIALALLQSFGLLGEIASNGVEAMEKSLAKPYAAVLMDCQMPEMDGYEATRRIRQAGQTRLPIVALTAGASSSERQLALDAGMDGFISKPVHRNELAQVLEQLLNRPRREGVRN